MLHKSFPTCTSCPYEFFKPLEEFDGKFKNLHPDNTKKYLEEQGYEYLKEERMGGLCVIEKNGEREYVVVSLNRYYSMWRWEPKNNV